MPTLTQYRRAVAPRLGPYVQALAGAGSSTVGVQFDTWPLKSALEQDDLYRDHFLFRPAAAAAADRTRVVAGYTAASGLLTPDLAWAATPAGETVELHGVVPPVVDGVNDLHALINEALKESLLVVEVTGTPVAQATRHSLGSIASWLQEPSWVYEMGYLGPAEVRDRVNPFRRPVRGSVEIDGESVYVDHGGRSFNTSDVLWVRLLKPAYHHCRPAAGAFGAQSGLALEGDECPVPVEWVVANTLKQAWLRLANVLAPADGGRADQELRKAAAQATRFQNNYLEAHRPRRSLRPLLRFGPVGRRW